MPEVSAPGAAVDLAAQLEEHLRAGRGLTALLPRIESVADLLCRRFAAGRTLFTFGNGGSAADAQHLSGELVGHYRRERRPVPAVTLSADVSVLTCVANDYAFDDVFARQVRALAHEGDVVAGFSTSGSSANVVRALAAAKRQGATTVLFGGSSGGPALEHADHHLLSPATSTPRIQEMHTVMLHLISDIVDAWAAAEETR